MRNIDDLTRLSPGVAFQRNGMSSAGNYNDEGSDINIRGVDSTAGTSTTGIYIDDTPIQTRHIGFGSINAVPGAVRPGPRRGAARPAGHPVRRRRRRRRGAVHRAGTQSHARSSAYARADVAVTDGGSPSYEGGVAFGAPIIDDVLAFRASVSYRRDGGWVDRTAYTLAPPGGARRSRRR